MVLSDVQADQVYIYRDLGRRTASGECIVPAHDLLVMITEKNERVCHFLALKNQFNPLPMSTDYSGVLSEAGVVAYLRPTGDV